MYSPSRGHTFTALHLPPRVFGGHADRWELRTKLQARWLVMDSGRVAGIFTEADVLRRVVAERRDPSTSTVGEVMTVEVVCCHPDDRQ